MKNYDYNIDDVMVYKHIDKYFREEITELQNDLKAMYKFFTKMHSSGDYLLLLENKEPIYDEDIEFDILECIESIGYVRRMRNRFNVIFDTIVYG